MQLMDQSEKTPKTVLAIRHIAFEDLGSFAEVFTRHNYRIEYRDAGVQGIDFAEVASADILVVLGGPISANDHQLYPYLADEVELISARLQSNRPMIGICLGAQLMAQALGARIYAAPQPEIGLAPLTMTDAGEESAMRSFKDVDVLHWHGETFDLPLGADRLASTAICINQAFSLGPNIIGLQFHPEAGGGDFERWLIGHHVELMQHGIDIDALRKSHAAAQEVLANAADRFLSDWLDALILPEPGGPRHDNGNAPGKAR